MKTQISILFAVLFLGREGHSQSFVNLGFESAQYVSAPAGVPYVQFAQAFPGWTATVGGVPQTTAVSNDIALDTSLISIINSAWVNPFSSSSAGVIQGQYTAILSAGLDPQTFQPADTTLSQTGLVPTGTQSLRFEALQPFGTSVPFGVTLGGQALSLVPLATGQNFTLYGADISSFAGHTEQLSFTAFTQNPHVSDQYLFLDAIQFSPSAVPEPDVTGLFALGGLLFACWRWRKSFQN